jgi:hypothetical protein
MGMSGSARGGDLELHFGCMCFCDIYPFFDHEWNASRLCNYRTEKRHRGMELERLCIHLLQALIAKPPPFPHPQAIRNWAPIPPGAKRTLPIATQDARTHATPTPTATPTF